MTDDQQPFPSDDLLAEAWRTAGDPTPGTASGTPEAPTRPNELAASVADAHRKDQRRLLWLNVQEVIPAFGLAALLGAWSIGAPAPWAVLTASGISLGVGGYLLTSSIRHHRIDQRFGGSMRAQLVQRLEQVRHRAALYRSVAWWYLAPIAFAIVLLRYGTAGELRLKGPDLAYYAFVAVFGAGLYVVNRRVGRKHYEPEVERLSGLLAEIDRVV
ncbi:MAG: hypothetical protein AAF567_19215 [Actinomycetota bacterium]